MARASRARSGHHAGGLRLAIGVAFAVATTAGGAWLWPSFAGGDTSLVTTHGNSMAPWFQTGDLAVVHATDRYDIGDVVAYHSEQLKSVVMHRIVALDGVGYVFQGDHNDFRDPEHPSKGQLIGRLVVRIPQGGVWLQRVTSPIALGVIAFGGLAARGAAVQSKRRRKTGTVSRHSVSKRHHPPSAALLATAPQWVQTAAAGAVAAGILGIALAALAWIGPVTRPATGDAPAKRSMTFSYSASVPRSPAYDGTTVTSPDPVFRTLADSVEVHFAYQGSPGTLAVSADLSTDTGWHSSVALTGPATFTTTRYAATVRLDLKALDARARAAAAVTGLPVSTLTVSVVPRVSTADGGLFAPTLPLTLSPLQLTFGGGAKALVVEDPTAVAQTIMVARTIGLLGHYMAVATGRTVSAILLLIALLTAAALAVVLRRSAPTTEGAGIRRHYGPLLVAVHPMATPPGSPVVDVTEFATLARLADRYGLLVLHWSRSDVETFVVQDEGTTYRYRTIAAAAGFSGPATEGAPAAKDAPAAGARHASV